MESALKLKLMDGLSKKIIALVGKWVCVLRRRRAGSTERMMGSDSGLSRCSGCPEWCEAPARRWQNRAGCQSGKVPLMLWKEKESACQTCSASQGRRREHVGIGVDMVELDKASHASGLATGTNHLADWDGLWAAWGCYQPELVPSAVKIQ